CNARNPFSASFRQYAVGAPLPWCPRHRQEPECRLMQGRSRAADGARPLCGGVPVLVSLARVRECRCDVDRNRGRVPVPGRLERLPSGSLVLLESSLLGKKRRDRTAPVPPLRGRPRPPAPVSLDPRRRVADAGATAPTGGTPMHVSALLEFDAVPVDSADTVLVLLDITAPEQPGADRTPAT